MSLLPHMPTKYAIVITKNENALKNVYINLQEKKIESTMKMKVRFNVKKKHNLKYVLVG